MHRVDGRWVHSPSDLVDFLDCDLRSALNQAHASSLPGAPEPTNTADRLASAHGQGHEHTVLEQLRARFPDGVVEIGQSSWTAASLEAAAAQTARAAAAQVPVIYQGVLYDGTFYGRPDFLIRADLSLTGPHSADRPTAVGYEPYDSKLARHAAPSAVVQLTAYATALTALGLPVPERMHLLLGDGEQVTLQVQDYTALVDDARARLLTRLSAPATLPVTLWGDDVPACATCRYADHCAGERERHRDLSLVAGIRADQRRKLHAAGLDTIDALAGADPADRPVTMSAKTFEVLRAQAGIQVRQDRTRTPENPVGDVVYEVADADTLAALPHPSPGDMYFDMEGDPYALGNTGLEYLFGVVTLDAATTPTLDRDAPSPHETFHAFWAHTRTQEKAAFEAFIDFTVDRLASYPDAHVYHYAPYEPTALKRLAAQHGTREDEVDQLLRTGALVDLYATVRKGVRVSQRSYSIKYLEAIYMPTGRTGDVATAAASIEAYEDYLAAHTAGDQPRADELLAGIGEYNEYDCVSTHRLHRWLLGVRNDQHISPAPVVAVTGEDEAALADRRAKNQEQEQAAALLTKHLPEDPHDWDANDQALAVLAGTLGYYRRELNPVWWEFFAQAEMPLHDLEQSTSCTVPVRVQAPPWEPPTGRARTATRALTLHTDPTAPHPFAEKDQVRLLYRTATQASTRPGTVTGVLPDGLLVVTERAKPDETTDLTPVAVLPGPPVPAKPKDQAVADLGAAAIASHPVLPPGPAATLLTRSAPTLRGGVTLPAVADHDGDVVQTVIAAVDLLEQSCLAVQGPPGSGKTYLATQLIKHLTGTGRSVGVCSTSHKAIENVLHGAVRACGPDLPVAKRSSTPNPDLPWHQPRDNRKLAAWRADAPPGHLVGGTAWNFAAPEMAADPVDVLIIDEAGQFALADALAVSAAARNIVLLGDPQQLPQVVQGTHPDGVGASALSHLLGGAEIVPDHLGYFLDQSRRMHPDVCAPVSQLAYQGRLRSHDVAAGRSIDGVPPGLHPVAVEHTGNATSSLPEAQYVAALAQSLLGSRFTDENGPRPMTGEDILVVAPFNSQVRLINLQLGLAGVSGVRVGTVDRFQGQEAPVVIVSMTTSSAAELTRGLDFLLSRNRLNVALSRAQVAAYLVYAPALRTAPARTVEQLRLVSGLVSLTARRR